MPIIPDVPPTSPADEIDCPSWCARERFHDLGEPFRDHRSTTVAIPSATSGSEIREVELTRLDSPGAPGAVEVVLDGQGDAPLDAAGARSLGEALLVVADAMGRPARGVGPRRVHGRPVLPRHLHDLACGWRIHTPDEDVADVVWCAGCGLGVAVPTVGGAR